jgi:potassium/sodium efflux P-type ATPase
MNHPPAQCDWSIKDVGEVVKALQTDPADGLTAEEAHARLQANGRNELHSAPLVPTWRRVLAQFQDPLIYLLLAAIAIAVVAWSVNGFPGWPIDAMVITAVVLLNGALGYLEEAKARNAVAALGAMTEAKSSVIRGGQRLQVNSGELVVGDLLVLAEGDAVGADARLTQAASLRLLEAPLTGESQAVLKSAARLTNPVALGDRLNVVFKGTAAAQGTGMAVVTATGMATEIGAIASMLKAVKDEPTPLEKEVSHIGRLLGIAVIVITLIVVGTILSISNIQTAADVVGVLLFGVALAVAAVPEGLPAILSVVLALGVRRMAGRHAIVKKLSSVEALGSATVIATDKTGTLTRSEMTIEQIITATGSAVVTGVGYAPDGHVQQGNTKLGPGSLLDEQMLLLTYGSLASNATLTQSDGGKWVIHGDPTEAAFLVAERKLMHDGPLLRGKRYERLGEIPFTSERKMMSTIEVDHLLDEKIILVCKGAPDVLLEKCTHVQIGQATKLLDKAQRAQILKDVDSMSDAALRTLAVAYRPLGSTETQVYTAELEHTLVYVGSVGMMDPPRKEAAVAIAQAQSAGIRVIMITGDHPRTAARIASDLGITQAGDPAVTGLEIDASSDADFSQTIRTTSVYARVSPANKLRIIAALQADGQVVAMTGDGINDAPALKSADVGIAMGITGTEVTKEAAKVILADDNFATIVDAVREGRNIFDNIRKFLRYLLSSNMGEVLTVFLGVVGASVIGLNSGASGDKAVVVLPLLATQILWLNLITDSWPALAIGTDPAGSEVMARKPRQIHSRVIDLRMWAGVVEIGLVIAVMTLLTVDMYLPGGLIPQIDMGTGNGDLATARTAGFTVLVMAHLIQCFNARSEDISAFANLLTNRWIWAAVALSMALQVAVVNVGLLNTAFGTAPLTRSQWLTCMAMASVVLWYSELRKLGLRTWTHRTNALALVK